MESRGYTGMSLALLLLYEYKLPEKKMFKPVETWSYVHLIQPDIICNVLLWKFLIRANESMSRPDVEYLYNKNSSQKSL